MKFCHSTPDLQSLTNPSTNPKIINTLLCQCECFRHASALIPQAAQPAYMKTNSGRVLEMPKTEEGPTTQQELQELTTTYEATVRIGRPFANCHFDTCLRLKQAWRSLWNLPDATFKGPTWLSGCQRVG